MYRPPGSPSHSSATAGDRPSAAGVGHLRTRRHQYDALAVADRLQRCGCDRPRVTMPARRRRSAEIVGVPGEVVSKGAGGQIQHRCVLPGAVVVDGQQGDDAVARRLDEALCPVRARRRGCSTIISAVALSVAPISSAPAARTADRGSRAGGRSASLLRLGGFWPGCRRSSSQAVTDRAPPAPRKPRSWCSPSANSVKHAAGRVAFPWFLAGLAGPLRTPNPGNRLCDVTYTVHRNLSGADIYYRDTSPPFFADYQPQPLRVQPESRWIWVPDRPGCSP